MRKLWALAIAGLLVAPAYATVYNDATGDLHASLSGHTHLDFSSLEITDDGVANITFKFTLVGNPVATDWGKYGLIFDTVPGGDTAANGNGWGRPYSMTSGADKWIGSWVDGTMGAQVWGYAGTWSMLGQSPALITVPTKTTSTITFSATLASLGLAPGSIFQFDAMSSGGGGADGAIDDLGNPNVQVAGWGDASTAIPLTYQVTPEPASLVLLVLGGAALLRRRS
jgi:hypothetical protein